MQEAQLYKYWEYYAAIKQVLLWQGNTLKIIFAGTLNEHEGPDYRGACFELNGVLFQGAVEMHISLDDWYKHQHHYDSAYREVQLHVILNEPQKKLAVNHVMRLEPIPTFVLPVPVVFKNKNKPVYCSAPNMFDNATVQLQKLALNRLQYKVHSLQKKLNTFSIHQLFYGGYLQALGYPHNKHMFEWLTLRVTDELVSKYKNSTIQLLALYLGVAGFLDHKFKEPL